LVMQSLPWADGDWRERGDYIQRINS
jgi:hypothetical protein